MDLPRPFGPYTLLRRLAVGGMAEVYIAKARGIGGFEKLVAIKVIHPRYSEDDHFVTMLVEEAKLSVLLTHVNIAQTFDLGCHEETYYIVMELVEGADAYKLLKRAAERPAKIPIDIAAYVAAEMCQGLDYAHRKRDMTGAPLSIVHRDISPQNVLISFAGEVKIVDFGIAKAALRSGNTEVGVIKGKYYYMSPEQAWADPVDSRSDIFSTGIVLHELLTGDMVYKEDNLPNLLDRVRKADIAPPSRLRPDVPLELDEIVMRALAKHPEERYESAHDFGQALTQFLYGYLPSFTPSRLAGMMGQLFPSEIEASSGGVQLPSGRQKVLSSIHTQDSTQETATSSSSVGPMRAEEFRPDPKKSVIFDLGEDFGDEETSNQIPKAIAARRVAQKAKAAEPDWEEPTTGARPTAKLAPNEDTTDVRSDEDEETWEDATVVDDSEGLMEKMRDLLERQVAERNRQGPPPSEDRTLPFDRAKLPPAIRAKAEAALAAIPKAAPPPSAPPPPPAPRAVAAARSKPPPPPAPPRSSAAPAIASWPPEGPTEDSAPDPGPGLPDLSGWRDASSEVRPAVGQRPAAITGETFDTHQLAAMTQAAKTKGRRRVLLGGLAVLLAVALFFIIRATRSEPVAPPRLEVRSVPAGARVFFDGEALPGETPLVIHQGLEVGQLYPVQVQLDGYEAWSSTYDAQPGSISQIAVLVPIRVDLTIRTDPPGGHVWVDGVDHGQAPIELPGRPVGQELRLRARIEGREVRETRQVAHDTTELVLSP